MSPEPSSPEPHAHKLEAIGQLAAGVAHELNTPIQYVADNIEFLSCAMDELLAAVRTTLPGLPAAAAVDLERLLDEVPRALADAIEGLGRVTAIVSALRSFSHPSRGQREAFDLNQTVVTTIALARTEWRYVAEVTTDLDPAAPPVVGIRDELAQAFLNVIVNAAHAIADVRARGRASLGRIDVSTRHVGDDVVIAVSDDGGGIPEAIRDHIFEPFVTTKPVGRGTGQGLALTRAVVDKHAGTVRFEPRPGGGTTFVITLPVRQGEGTDP